MAALRSQFDSNKDGKLTSADAGWGQFKVMVTNANGSQTASTLTARGITEIDLTPNATHIELPDGSVITGQSTFVIGGVTRTVANTTLVSEANGYRLEQTLTPDQQTTGARTVVSSSYDLAGNKVSVVRSVTSADGTVITNSYDGNGDGVYDQAQTITTATVSGVKTETLVNYQGDDISTAGVVLNKVASMGQKGPEIVPGVVDGLVARALAHKLDVIILDPLGALHTLPENSNEAANLLSGALREIAHRATEMPPCRNL